MKKSPLLEDTTQVDPVDYTEDEGKYLGAIRSRLEQARDARNGMLEEFDGMDYLTWHLTNERLANTYVGAKKNKTDSNFQSGMIRNKIFAFLSEINRMNLEPDVLSFDKNEVMIGELGNAITEVLRKTEELEDDEEKRLMRQYEMLKQGTVFVEDIWKKGYKTVKKVTGTMDDPSKVKWTEKVEEYMSRPHRSILHGPGVYLGSMNTFDIKDQPYIFTVDVVPYEKAKSIFGKWDRWENVPPKLTQTDGDYNWRLTEIDNDQVEIIKYQDKPNDEFQILLNGVMMLPVGFPLSAVSCNGEYTITKQIFKMIRHNFPYGKSLCMELRNQVGVYDELLKIDVLKAQKSAFPPYLNNTGQVLTSRVLMPGQFLMGVKPGGLTRLDERDTGVTNGDVAVLEMISQRIDESSVGKQYQGGEAPGSTLGEAQLAQQQSDMIVGLAVFACSLLEKKLAEMRIPILFKYWFEPKMDAPRDALTKYRVSNIEASIPGRGMGRSMVIPTEEIPNSQEVYQQEERESEAMGMPIRKYYLNPKEIKKSEYIWMVSVNPTPRRGDAQDKLMLNAMITQLINTFGPMANLEYIGERFAETWGEDSTKLFTKQQVMPQPIQPQPTQGTPQIKPQVNKVGINPNL